MRVLVAVVHSDIDASLTSMAANTSLSPARGTVPTTAPETNPVGWRETPCAQPRVGDAGRPGAGRRRRRRGQPVRARPERRDRVEPPRGAADRGRPGRRQHRPVRVRQPGPAGLRHVHRELDPVRGAQRRPELLPVRHRRPRTTSTSTTTATPSRTPSSGGRSRTSTSGAATRSCTTTARSPRSTTRTCCSGRPTRWSRRSTAAPFKTRVSDAPVAPSRVGPASMPDYETLRDQADLPAARAAGRSSPARPTTRSSSTCASSTCSTAAT